MILCFFVGKKKYRKAIIMSLVDQTFPLFKPPFVLNFFACSFLHFGIFSISAGMGSFLPDVLNRLQKAYDDGNTYGDLKVCDVIQMDMSTKTSNGSVAVDYVSHS